MYYTVRFEIMHQCSSCDGSPPLKVTQCPTAPPCSGQQVLCSVGLSLTPSRSVFLDSNGPLLAQVLPVWDLFYWMWCQLMVGNGQFSLALSESLLVLMKCLVPAKIRCCHCQPNVMALPIGMMGSQGWKRKEMYCMRECVWLKGMEIDMAWILPLCQGKITGRSLLKPQLYG